MALKYVNILDGHILETGVTGETGIEWVDKALIKKYTDADIGTTAQLTLTDGTTYDIVLIGINHDDLADGSGKAHTTRQFVNLYNTYYQMRFAPTNEGGWQDSLMRKSVLKDILNLFPSSIKNVIKTVLKPTFNGGNQSGVALVNSSDQLFLLSMVEIGGADFYSIARDTEGTQYAYWVEKDDERYRKKGKQSSPSSANTWWSRSPAYYISSDYCYVKTNGLGSNGPADTAYGVCPAFCI